MESKMKTTHDTKIKELKKNDSMKKKKKERECFNGIEEKCFFWGKRHDYGSVTCRSSSFVNTLCFECAYAGECVSFCDAHSFNA